MNKGIVLKDAQGNKYYPESYYEIGDLFFTTNNKNPKLRFGGTWTLWGAGRVPVCVNTEETEFNTVEKIGGSKFLQEHYHKARYGTNTSGGDVNRLVTSVNTSTSGRGDYTTTGVEGVSVGNSGNLQPYITCYIWKRIA